MSWEWQITLIGLVIGLLLGGGILWLSTRTLGGEMFEDWGSGPKERRMALVRAKRRRRGWNLAPVYLVEFEDESGRLTTCRVMIDTFQKAEPGLEGMLVTRGKRFVSFGEDENEED